ncbi:MAG: hypothetical protein WBA89_19540 [Microcoleus sp.]|uniref:hypothetical protein n=1 Tax=Microcoleus sp. TaxID=44472 RepID=UPI003C77B191
MQFVERQVIKPNHRFYREADRLFLLSKNHKCDRYIYLQHFFLRQSNNALAVSRPPSKSVGGKTLPSQATIKIPEKKEQRFYAVVLHCQAVSKNPCQKK